jgi:proteic killer suppression protein
MIKSFKDKETQKLFKGRKSKAVPEALAARARVKLVQLEKAKSVQELGSPPGNRLHPLREDRKGQWSMSINNLYRVCFYFEDGNAFDVEATDYH